MFDDVASRSFHVINPVPSFWIVGFTVALNFATLALALLAGHVACTRAGVGRSRRRGSALIVVFSVRIRVRRGLAVGSMFVREGAILVSVVSVPLRGRERALVGKGFMKECLVMLLCSYVELPVIRCCHVATTGALSGATVDSALRLAGLL